MALVGKNQTQEPSGLWPMGPERIRQLLAQKQLSKHELKYETIFS